jgi:hypothetical protein
MEWRDLVLFIAYDQRINYTSMGYCKRPTNKLHKYGMQRSCVIYSKSPTNKLHKNGI